jgi:hypothetical protein
VDVVHYIVIPTYYYSHYLGHFAVVAVQHNAEEDIDVVVAFAVEDILLVPDCSAVAARRGFSQASDA